MGSCSIDANQGFFLAESVDSFQICCGDTNMPGVDGGNNAAIALSFHLALGREIGVMV